MSSKVVTMTYLGANQSLKSKELYGDQVGYTDGRAVGIQGGPFDTARIWNESTTFAVPLNRLVSIEVHERENESRAAAETE